MAFKWDAVPEHFHYLRNSILDNRETELRIYRFDPQLNRHVGLCEKLNAGELAELGRVYDEICRREDNLPILDWIQQSETGTGHAKEASYFIGGLLRLFEDLAEQGIEPFTSLEVIAAKPEPPRQIDPSRVPVELRQFIPFVEKWGAAQSDTERYELAAHAEENPAEMVELKEIAARFTVELQEIMNLWHDREPITDSHEAAKFYFAVMLLAELELLQQDANWNTVEKHTATLGKFGSYRLASERMHAAKFLAEFEDQAKSALPALHQALNDEDGRVRVWAHYAIYQIDGQSEQHLDAIRQSLRNANEEVRSEAKAALYKLGPLAKPAIPDLIERIDQDDGEDIPLMIEALGVIGANDARAIEALKRATASDNKWICEAAEDALASMKKSPRQNWC